MRGNKREMSNMRKGNVEKISAKTHDNNTRKKMAMHKSPRNGNGNVPDADSEQPAK